MKQDPLTRAELIAIRDGNTRNADVRALLREIRRQHDVILEIEKYRQDIEMIWREDVGSPTAGMHKLRVLLQDEVRRFPR